MNEPVKRIMVAPKYAKPLVAWTLLSALLTLRAFAAGPAAANSDAPTAQAKAQKEAALVELFQSDSNITNSLGNLMIHVPAGYRVAQYEVTQGDYEQIMGDNPSRFKGTRRPVEQVSWKAAQDFCSRLTQKDKDAGLLPSGYAYALPTEAQWEYFVDETRLEDAITSHLGDRRSTENVGGLSPNSFGLYDTRGNVWEWCATPVARGGSWQSHEDYLAINFRFIGESNLTYQDIGFRVLLQAPAAAH